MTYEDFTLQKIEAHKELDLIHVSLEAFPRDVFGNIEPAAATSDIFKNLIGCFEKWSKRLQEINRTTPKEWHTKQNLKTV